MALQDTPPLADPVTGRIPAYTQVLKQDPNTGVYSIKYDVKPIPTVDSGLTTPITQLPGVSARIGTGTQDDEGTDTNTGTDVGATVTQQGAAGGRDQGGVYDFQREQRGGGGIPFGGTPMEQRTLSDFDNVLNPSGTASAITGGLISFAPTILGGLIAAGTSQQQRDAVKEINRRAEAGSLFKNPDGTLVTNNQLAAFKSNIGVKYGIPGFRQQLSEKAQQQINAGIMGQAFQLDDNSTTIAQQYENPVSEAQFNAMMNEAMRDYEVRRTARGMNLGTTTLTGTPSSVIQAQPGVDPSLMDVSPGSATTPLRQTNIGDTIAAEDEAAGVQTGDAAVAEAEAPGRDYGWNSTDGSTMTSNSTTTNADGTTTTNLSGLQTANQVVSEGTGGSGNYSQNQVNNAQNQINGAVQQGGPGYGMTEGTSAVGYGFNPETGNYAGTVSYSGGTVTNNPANNPGLNRDQPNTGQDDGPCFLAGTLITMSDETKKPIEEIELMDKVAIGGYVGGVGKFLTDELYDYNGVKVSGSHLVNEDNKWMHVKDSKNGKPLGNDTHVVYVLGTEHRRLLIENILFTDYLETKEQEMFIAKGSDYFFNNHGSIGNQIAKENLKTLNAEN